MSPVKPTCDLECALEIARDAAKLSQELAEIAGAFNQSEQYREADTATIARLRRDLDEARADISVLRDDRDRIRTVSAEALALRDRLSTIIDKAFGVQEVLGVDALLSRLERLLTERARQHEEVRRERDEAIAKFEILDSHRRADNELISRLEFEIAKLQSELDKLGADRHDALSRRRAAAQILIAEIGASGPEDIVATARRAVERIQELKGVAEDLCSSCDPSIHIGNLTEALQDLVKSVEATKTRDAIVLRDIEAARAVLGGRS